MSNNFFIGVDVGTSTVRAAIVNSNGVILNTHYKSIKTWNPRPNFFEQSSDDIWDSVCECVKILTTHFSKKEIIGIGFDATSSLVVLDEDFNPLSISSTGKDELNVIASLDHRAGNETEIINSTKHEILNYVGGRETIDMIIPKLLWIKRNLPFYTWKGAKYFLELSDFLTWKATGSLSRSLCSVICKWNYDGINNSWSKDFFEKINLHELSENNFEKIGQKILKPGESIVGGLREKAAIEFHLLSGIAVSVSLLQSHAGALALLNYDLNQNDDNNLSSKMCLSCGISSCYINVTKESNFTKLETEGPCNKAIFSDMYLIEAGQSATCILIDHIIKTHPAYKEIINRIGDSDIYTYLDSYLHELVENKNNQNIQELTKDVHIWPDFHGNISPIVDSNMRGMIAGLTINNDIDGLAILYLALIQSLAYETRYVLEHLEKFGHPKIKSLLICGDLSKNNLFIQTYSDICMIPLLLPEHNENATLGAAILGACAAKQFPDLQTSCKSMSRKPNVILPNDETKMYHMKKYQVFKKMLEHQREYKEIMND